MDTSTFTSMQDICAANHIGAISMNHKNIVFSQSKYSSSFYAGYCHQFSNGQRSRQLLYTQKKENKTRHKKLFIYVRLNIILH
jgi:hypothetical protein